MRTGGTGRLGWAQALVLGAVQGATEFLPVSSSAHVSVVGRLFGRDPGAAFSAITQLGTEAAVLVHLRADVARVAARWAASAVGRAPRDDPDARMGWLIIAGTIPIGALGFGLRRLVTGPFRNPWVTAVALAAFAPVLAHADRVGSQRKGLADLTVRDGLAFGLWQSLALVPGVSRSGASIAGGLYLGYTREAAARYSFLLAIPAVVASGLHQLLDLADEPEPPAWGSVGGATLVSFAVGHVAVGRFLRHVSRRDLAPFVRYRLAFAAVVAALEAGRARRRARAARTGASRRPAATGSGG
ncbi:undecaprenyl-diphosphate phosphatase [Agilicoccus flavus]|uniref:undecaprenyl-diphosphate phosphatase n=1 Tax=Agilicoccus flavus TaxID=2775968 RepID=UPI001CF6CAA3|nr:undecaprenyl-diphosphate phosphatase [Agilicoccus flavus]